MPFTIHFHGVFISADNVKDAAALARELAVSPEEPPQVPALPAPSEEKTDELDDMARMTDGDFNSLNGDACAEAQRTTEEPIQQSAHDKLGDAIFEALNAAGEPLTRTGIMTRVLGRIPSGEESRKVIPFIKSGELRCVRRGVRELYEIAD